MIARRWIIPVLVLLLSLTAAACTEGQSGTTETAQDASLAAATSTEAYTSTCACGGMPLVDETFVPPITEAAKAAFERDFGDGSGVYVVWGPNVVGDWAMIGLQNESGSGYNQALLHLEMNGEWLVKAIGNGLEVEWQSQTPPELWPTG